MNRQLIPPHQAPPLFFAPPNISPFFVFPPILPPGLAFPATHPHLPTSGIFLFFRLRKEKGRKRMNRCSYQHQKAALEGLGCVGEIRRGDSFVHSPSCSSMAACPNVVVCPKPRRLANINVNFHEPINIRPSRVVHTPNNYQMEACESTAGTDLLDLILKKGNIGAEKPNFQVPSSPPFFSGSPPVRASNPVILDEQFGIGKMMSPLSPSVEALAKNGSGGSSGRVKCVNKPAPVRIEGFNCRGTAVVA